MWVHGFTCSRVLSNSGENRDGLTWAVVIVVMTVVMMVVMVVLWLVCVGGG